MPSSLSGTVATLVATKGASIYAGHGTANSHTTAQAGKGGGGGRRPIVEQPIVEQPIVEQPIVEQAPPHMYSAATTPNGGHAAKDAPSEVEDVRLGRGRRRRRRRRLRGGRPGPRRLRGGSRRTISRGRRAPSRSRRFFVYVGSIRRNGSFS